MKIYQKTATTQFVFCTETKVLMPRLQNYDLQMYLLFQAQTLAGGGFTKIQQHETAKQIYDAYLQVENCLYQVSKQNLLDFMPDVVSLRGNKIECRNYIGYSDKLKKPLFLFPDKEVFFTMSEIPVFLAEPDSISSFLGVSSGTAYRNALR